MLYGYYFKAVHRQQLLQLVHKKSNKKPPTAADDFSLALYDRDCITLIKQDLTLS